MKEKNLNKYPGTIKQCPFCGETPAIEQKMLTHAFVVRCKNPKCEVQPSTRMHESLVDAVEVWRERY